MISANGVAEHVPIVLQVHPHLTYLAFSGGGICSATFHLGVLQSLHDMQRLPKIDYLSMVSGESYMAEWMLAHLGQEQEDAYGNLVQTMGQGKLLDPHQDFIAHLRYHSGFIKEGRSGKGRSSCGLRLAAAALLHVGPGPAC